MGNLAVNGGHADSNLYVIDKSGRKQLCVNGEGADHLVAYQDQINSLQNQIESLKSQLNSVLKADYSNGTLRLYY